MTGGGVVSSGASFGLLGPLQVSVGGAALALGGPKQRAVLAALLINRARPVAVDSLITAAWGEAPPGEARTNLHVYVSNLRRVLATGGMDGRAMLEKCPPGYRLNVEVGGVDAGRFVRENTAGVHAAAARRFEEASRHFGVALSQWRGPVLADLAEFGFVEGFAVAMTEQKLATHTARAEAEIACRRAESMIGELEALVAEHPYREPLWAQLMTAYYVAGRQSDALGAFRRVQRILANDLGIDPNASVRDLHARILRQDRLDVERSAAATATATLEGTGQRVWEGLSAGLAARLHSVTGDSHSVTGPATSIGRSSDNDIVLVDARVSRRHAMIVRVGIGFVIHDTGSANGVEINSARIAGSAALAHGDEVRIGNSEFTFEIRFDG